MFLSDPVRAWLEHLPPLQIHNWRDLVKIFVGNFQGTYVRPGNSWDLKSCRQKRALGTPIGHLEPEEHPKPSHGVHTFLLGLWSRGYPPH